ncbi:MAG: U32 family peptidase [Planctomycetaceae bacterium]|nr:U32 family peptidase [Planctomycetaceae bacterium]
MKTPELLSPAGSLESLYAAVENGADAVYFGIRSEKYRNSFNARSRAENIPLEQIADTLTFLHSKNVKGYVALNTLVFSAELSAAESLLKEIALAGADAVIVQDFGIAKLANRICPDLPLHSSTQMSLTAFRGIETAAETFGIKRAIVPRELSLEEIRKLKTGSSIELECFVHGALCICFSGQCFASFGLGGNNVQRSANRGGCAQPCRLPYTLMDGETNAPLTSPKQLLSPYDLSALPLLEELVAAGIDSLKIEGRLKPPEYVAETTRIYRNALDKIAGKISDKTKDEEAKEQLALTFSRGFSTGWLRETEQLVPGNVRSHRGTLLGTVIEVRRDAAVVQLVSSVKCGDGVVFDNDTNEEDEEPQGGRVYEIFRRGTSVKEAEAGAKVLLTFANHSIDADKVHSGQTVRKTDDPHYRRSVQRSIERTLKQSKSASQPNIPLVLHVEAVAGKPLSVSVFAADTKVLQLVGESPLEVARKHPLTLELLREQFNRLGGTAYFLADITAVIEGHLMLPLSELGKHRRSLVEKLDALGIDYLQSLLPQKVEVKRSVNENALTELRTEIQRKYTADRSKDGCVYHRLFRDVSVFENTDLLKQYIAEGCTSFYGELQTMGQHHFAARAVRDIGGTFTAVLPRIVKPLDERILAQFAKLHPDAFLVRNLEELIYFRNRDKNVPLIADFSFNVVNEISFSQLLDWGATRITPGFDCAADADFLKQFPTEKIERILTGRLPLFVMQHCLWKGNLVKNGEECERLCRSKPLKIKDRYGALHTVRSDVLCRNTVFNSDTFTAEQESGIGHWRIEL